MEPKTTAAFDHSTGWHQDLVWWHTPTILQQMHLVRLAAHLAGEHAWQANAPAGQVG